MSVSISLPALPISDVRLNPIGPQSVGFPFIVGGTFYFAIEDAGLESADDASKVFTKASVTVKYTPTPFTFTHPAITTPGEHTISVAVQGTNYVVKSNTFSVNTVYETE